jgi:hypothetical protein
VSTGRHTAKSESAGLADTPKVSAATDDLLSILQEGKYEYALVGGLAVVLQGHNRYTQDVDALVWDLDIRLEQFFQAAADRGWRLAKPDGLAEARSDRILFLLTKDGTAVDVFLGFLPFEREIIDRATTLLLHEGVSGLVSTAEDLVIMKLIAGRSQDLYDVVALCDLHPDIDKDRVARVVSEYAEILDRPDISKNLDELIR